MDNEFKDKVIVVTGAAGNLGHAVATAFAQRGARMALLDLSEQTIQPVVDDLPPGTEAKAYAVNLLEAKSVDQGLQAIVHDFGRIDVLANIAGGFSMGPLVQDTSDADWDLMMNLNVRSIFYTCRAAIPNMLENGGGRVVNVSARAALEGKGRMGPYCASKAAVRTLTESLAAENKFDNITVNCILPGTIDTPQNRDAMPDANFSNWVPPEALADVVVFLASEASRCVTGAAIPVYGRS
jgi:NAD(P)-dependent dehydrogenase (short-subunit alcohol dehydrogenase family)